MNSKPSIRDRITSIIVFLFLTHGVVYFFLDPNEIYNLDSPVRFIKYVLTILFIVFNIDRMRTKGVLLFVAVASAVFISYAFSDSSYSVFQGVLYIAPLIVLAFDFNKLKSINFYQIVVYTFAVATVVGLVEFLVLDNVFSRFMGYSGSVEYRAVSVFVNPNNYGISIVLAGFYLLFYWRFRIDNIYAKGALLAITGYQTLISGSKTALVGFVLLSAAYIWIGVRSKKTIKHKDVLVITIITTFLSIPASIFFAQSNVVETIINPSDEKTVRSFSMSSMDERYGMFDNFFSVIEDGLEYFIFPSLNSNLVYIDNSYLFVWAVFGIFPFLAMVIFMLWTLRLLYVRGNMPIFYIYATILAMCYTTNIIYLWPLGYILWSILAMEFQPFRAKISR